MFKVDVDYSEDPVAGVVSEAGVAQQMRVSLFLDVSVDDSSVASQGWPPFAAGMNDFTVDKNTYHRRLPYVTIQIVT